MGLVVERGGAALMSGWDFPLPLLPLLLRRVDGEAMVMFW